MKQISCSQAPAHTSNRDKTPLSAAKTATLDQLDSEKGGK